MQPFSALGIFVSLLAVISVTAHNKHKSLYNSVENHWKPTDWLSVSELQALPALDKITLEELERMTLEEGATMVNKMYHLQQIKTDFDPKFVPEASEVPAYLVQCDMQIEKFRLSETQRYIENQLKTHGKQEFTIFITGFPNSTHTISKANRKLVEAYVARYSAQKHYDMQNYEKNVDSYETNNENTNYMYGTNENSNRCFGMLLVVDLGNLFEDTRKWASLDVETSGEWFAKGLVKVTDELNMPYETIHIVGQGISAHVAGAAGRAFTRFTGHQLRRITGLDPSAFIPRRRNSLAGLARGDAEFVDAIHTSVYGLGTDRRCGNVDFFPNGPSTGVPGTDNVVEASMRATRYFAESVRPGNERNFPAVAATSYEQYKKNQGNGRRAYMGIATKYDVEGDYILQVNPRSPFGQKTPAEWQRNYHNQHMAWSTRAQKAN